MGTQLRAENLAVCSWSLGPSDPANLIDQLSQAGIKKVQLALDPVARAEPWAAAGERLAEAGIEIALGMFGCVGEDYSTLESIRATGGIVPDATWADNWANIQQIVPTAMSLGVKLVTFHAGFLPESPDDPSYRKLMDRLRQIAELFAAAGIDLAFETGQETAETLKAFLDDLAQPNVGVNFDPANMILYGKGDPVEAVKILSGYLKSVHIKDAVPAEKPGEWGTEVVVGTGAVDWPGFFEALAAGGFCGPLAIEREGGDQRVADVVTAKQFVIDVLAKGGAA